MIRANIAGVKQKIKNWVVWDCCNSNCVVTIVRFQACVHSLEAKRCGHHSQNKPVVYVWKYLSVLSLDFWLLNFILISFRWAEAGGHEQISHKLQFNKQWALHSNSTDRVSALCQWFGWHLHQHQLTQIVARESSRTETRISSKTSNSKFVSAWSLSSV